MGLERQAHRKKVHTIPELTLMDEILSWNLPLKLIQLLGRVVTVMSWEAPFIPPSTQTLPTEMAWGCLTISHILMQVHLKILYLGLYE